jgi:single-strand DNA-binding protein
VINRVILVGNLTRDADTTAGPATTLARMRIATNAVWRDAEGNRQESSEFHNVVAFGRLAEICATYCLRGRRVYIEGRLRTREYEGGDGLRRHTTEIVAETMKLLDRSPTAEGDAHGNAADGADLDTNGTVTEPDPAHGSRAGKRPTLAAAPTA